MHRSAPNHQPLENAMYGFAKDLKLEGILGAQIQEIRLGRYDVQFLFCSGSSIAIQSLIEVFQEQELIATWDQEINWFEQQLPKASERYCD